MTGRCRSHCRSWKVRLRSSEVFNTLLGFCILSVFACPSSGFATGFFGPIQYLDNGGRNIDLSPEFFWELAPGYTLYRELLPVSAKSGEVQLSPDTWTLLALNKRTSLNEVIYPGDGLPKVELERLQSVFSDITFRSFEEESFNIRASGRKHPEPREVVVFSVSEPPDQDLLRRGFTVAHLDDLVLRVARLVLRWNADVAYGGRPREGFTASSCRGCRKPLKV